MSNDIIVAPESVSRRPLPANFDPADLPLFSHEREKTIPATRLLLRRDVHATPEGLLFRRGRALAEAHAHASEARTWETPRARLRLAAIGLLQASRNVVRPPAVWITDSQSFEYFHWMTDALPRLLAARDHLAGARLFLPAGYRAFPYVAASLRAFPEVEVGFVERPTRFKKLLLPTLTAPTGNYNEALVRALRDCLRACFVRPEGPASPPRIYISRERARRRKVVNETGVRAALEPLGYATVHFEGLAFDEQARIAAAAQEIVSNHGAGLANMLFMRPGGRVLELRRSADAHFNCYYALASALGLGYHYQNCAPRVPGEPTHTADLIVDVPTLQRNAALMARG